MLKPTCLFALSLSLVTSFSHAENERTGDRAPHYHVGGMGPAADGHGGLTRPSQSKPKIYRYRVGGVTTFSDFPPLKASYVVVNLSCFACNPASPINWQATRLFRNEYSDIIDLAAEQYRVDPALVRAVIHAESGFSPRARSPKGAIGLMQLMPGTAREVGVIDPHSPAQNIRGGVRYLAGLLARFQNNITLATAAYNAGPGAVEKYSGVPPYAETQAYVQRVNLLRQRYQYPRME